MSKRRIDIDPNSGQLRVSFEYDAELVKTVKQLRGRRWDPRQRAWFIPARALADVWAALGELRFNVSDGVRELGEERGIALPPSVTGLDDPEAFTVALDTSRSRVPLSDLNHTVRARLIAAFPEDIWVVGSLSDWNPDRGRTVWFELVELDPNNSGTTAKASAVLFQRGRARMEKNLAAVGGIEALTDGVQVCLKVRVELYPATGRYQLIVEDIDPSYTLGRLTQKRDMILRRLGNMGVTEKNRGVPMKAVPLRVGLITSVGSHAYADVIGELTGAGFGFEVRVYDAQMQGRYLEATVGAGLRYFAEAAEPVDVVLIVRGGGARTDLGWFDTWSLALAVCQHPLPVVVGIGHHDDRCVLDEVARSFRTPTAAARSLVELVQAFVDQLDDLQEQLQGSAEPLIAREREQLQLTAHGLAREARHALMAGEQELRHQAGRLDTATATNFREASRRVARLGRRLPEAVERRLGRERQQLDFASEHRLSATRLLRGPGRQRVELDAIAQRLGRASGRLMQRRGELLDQFEARRRALDPRRVLGRGFAVVRGREGAVVRRAGEVEVDDALRIMFADGAVAATVTEEESG